MQLAGQDKPQACNLNDQGVRVLKHIGAASMALLSVKVKKADNSGQNLQVARQQGDQR